jgi:hypothetical protein
MLYRRLSPARVCDKLVITFFIASAASMDCRLPRSLPTPGTGRYNELKIEGK